MQTFSIASVTVAYNGEGDLPRHLKGLLNQTVPLTEIIVVNNASTDGTLRLLSKEYPEVTVLDLGSNSGVGGGYAAGLAYAVNQKKYDWVWLFDQDSVPTPECLERLLATLNTEEGPDHTTAILAPTCLHRSTMRDYPGLLWRNGWRKVPAEQSVTFVDAVISSGSLIRSEAIKRAGPPREDFFIDYIDLEHCLRLRSSGYRIAVVRDAILHHSLGAPRIVRLGSLSRVWADHVPWREYYKARNEVFTIWTHYPNFASKWSVVRRLIRHALGILLFGKEKIACLRMMCHGVVDGRAGRLGIRTFESASIAPTERRSHA